MHIFSTFEHSQYVELALSSLETKGITKEQILAVPLENRVEERKLLDTIHQSDGVSIIDLGMALATACSVVGASIGFVLKWGPIYWGLLTAFIGFGVGLLVKVWKYKVFEKNKRLLKGKKTEIIVVVHCRKEEAPLIEAIMWEHLALGVAYVKGNES